MMNPFSRHPLVEKRIHICHQIFDERQIAQWPDLNLIVDQNPGYMRSASPAWYAVYHHGATAAHTHPTGEPVAKRRVGVLLNPRHNIKHCLVRLGRYVEALQKNALVNIVGTTLDSDLDRLGRHTLVDLPCVVESQR